MMELKEMDYGYAFTQENGKVVAMTWKEYNFLQQEMEKNKFRNKIAEQVDFEEEEDNLDFSRLTKEEFIDMCMDDAMSKYECYGDSFEDIDPSDIVFDIAQEQAVWKE